MSEIPEERRGIRFTQNYRRKAEEASDSVRARRRFGSLLEQLGYETEVINAMERDLGCSILYRSSWPERMTQLSLDDFLDLPSTVFGLFVAQGWKATAWKAFLADARRIYQQEQISYLIDDYGGVHPRVDAEFETAKDAAIRGLEAPRYATARAEFEKGMRALDGSSPDYGAAIRDVFFAIEAVFKTVAPKALRLGKAETGTFLKPILDRLFNGQKPEQQVAAKLVAQLGEWADASHFYRHAKGGEQVQPPPVDIAIALIHQGAAHLRWLIDIDTRILQSENPKTGAK